MTDWQIGLQAFREGRMREAADRLGAALEENELTVSRLARYETCAYLGAARYSLGLPVDALAAFEAALQFAPSPAPPADLLMNLAHAYLAAGRPSDARAALSRLRARTPGHVAANMLAARLDTLHTEDQISGAVLGVSPETAETYIRTLTFSRRAAGGYEPAEVQEALGQLQRYIESLTDQLELAETKAAQADLEIQRYRQMEDAVVENIMQFQPTAQTAEGEVQSGLSPIEILFQQKS